LIAASPPSLNIGVPGGSFLTILAVDAHSESGRPIGSDDNTTVLPNNGGEARLNIERDMLPELIVGGIANSLSVEIGLFYVLSENHHISFVAQ